MEVTPAPPGAAKFDRTDGAGFLITAGVALGVYLFTLAPNLTLGWSGVHATAAYHAGVTATPGFPVWTLYAWVFSNLIPFSNIAWRIALGSAVATAELWDLFVLFARLVRQTRKRR